MLEGAQTALADGNSFGASLPAFITPEFVRDEVARGPRHHPGQHQPPRGGADGDRPQLPRQDQRQYRQFGRDLVGSGGGGETGLGDPLGRRHGDGSLHWSKHPQHPLVDRAQLARAHRHRADLPGAGEGRRRSAEARLGGLQGYPHRAGRAGHRLLHHPCGRPPRPCAAHRAPGHRHCQPRRLDHGALVPRRSPGIVPLRAVRRDLRHHEGLRRLVLAGRRPAPWLHRGCQRRGAVCGTRDPRRADEDRLGQGLPDHDRGSRPRADAQDQGEHGKAAGGVRRGAVSTPSAR